MKRERHGRRISIKWKVFLCFLFFTVMLLVILWLFQTVYLGRFYMRIKKDELQTAAKSLLSDAGAENYQEIVEEVAKSCGISVQIFDNQGRELYKGKNGMAARLHYAVDFDIWYEKAKENGGEYTEERSLFLEWRKEDRPGERPPDWLPPVPRQSAEEIMTWVSLVTVQGEEWVYILESVLTPVDATVDTLRIQLIYISCATVLMSLLMAWILSRGISRSLIRVNVTARELAKANYDVTFEEGDCREIAELSETLNYAAGELGKTERFQRELLANVSHDLRTPLTMITAYGEMLRDFPDENTPENVQVIIDEARRLTLLVNDLLDMSRLRAGTLTLTKKSYNFTQSVRETVARFTAMLRQEGYTIAFLCGQDEEAMVNADKEKLDQVIYNLIGNAVNYTGEDKRVTVRQLCRANVVRLEITDTGEGIPKEEIPYIWERYYKVEHYHKRAVSGTGLGLSIVKSILNLHGAEYGAESLTGAGSTFWFEMGREI